MELLELRTLARAIVDDPALTYRRQRMHRLAVLAENSLEPPPVSAACTEALDKRIVCDMYEGNAPHRPRYVLPTTPRCCGTGRSSSSWGRPTTSTRR